MPRVKLKAFDPHNPDTKARAHWDRLQRGEHKHQYDQPLTKRQLKQENDNRPSLALRRFQAQVAAAKGEGGRDKREKAQPDTQAERKKGKKREREEKKEGKVNEQGKGKKWRREEEEMTDEQRREAEEKTRKRWEDKARTMTSHTAHTNTSSSTPSSPPSPPYKDFLPAESIPFGFQVDRPPLHLPSLKQRPSSSSPSSSAHLSLADYAAERHKAMDAYKQLRQRRKAEHA